MRVALRFITCAAAILLLNTERTRADDPLPSWNNGANKSAIISFVTRVTTEGSPDFVKPGERIAVFDNGGTLWCEQPIYFQFAFVIDRIKAMAGSHPEWKDREPFKSVLAGDIKGAMAGDEKGAVEMTAATHAGMTTDEFKSIVADWMKTARHPKYRQPYNQCIYQPMLEVLAYLRVNGFKTFIVSAAAWSSCVRLPKRPTASRPSRWSAAAGNSNSNCVRASSCW